MIRGTFANVRLRNHLVPGVEGGFTRHLPDGEQQSIFDAAMAYAERYAADRPRRLGLRLRVVAGLGGQGNPKAPRESIRKVAPIAVNQKGCRRFLVCVAKATSRSVRLPG